jgi:pimeloyl-ACP methyl ester carboxylesterase
MLRRYSPAILLLLLIGCTTEATEVEINGCREACRTELICALNQGDFEACGAACAEKIEQASDGCREALAGFGQCSQGLSCVEHAAGSCNPQNRAVVDNCTDFTIDGVLDDRQDGGYAVPDGGIGTGPGDRPDGGPKDAGFADPNTLLEGQQNLNGLKTYMKIAGTRSSTMPPAVVLNGGAAVFLPIFGSVIAGPGLSHEYLVPFMAPIQDNRLIVYYDMRATGRSSFGTIGGTSTVTLSQHVNDLTDVLDFVKDFSGQDKVDLIGFGYGALVGALYAAQHPARISRLVATTPFPTNNGQYIKYVSNMSRRMTSADRQQAQMIAGWGSECLQNESQCFLQLWGITGPRTMCPDKFDQFVDLSFLYGSGRALYYVVQQLRDTDYDFAAALRNITAPTTIISGACDAIPPETPASYATEIPGAIHHVLTEAGGFPMVETSTSYRRILKSALIYP